MGTAEGFSGTIGTEGSSDGTDAEGVRVESVEINVSDDSDSSGKEDGISGGSTEGGCSGKIVSVGRSEEIVSASDLGGKTIDVGLEADSKEFDLGSI